MKENTFALLLVIYVLAAFFSFAILRYLFLFVWANNTSATDTLAGVRVFLSAPMLILLGVVLILVFKSTVHKAFGVLFAMAGLIWAVEVVKTFIAESA